MKKYFLSFILFPLFCLLATSLFANDFNIEKINEFAFAQSFNTSEKTLIIEYPYLYALTSHGLEIYEIIDNESLERLSIIPITFPRRFELKENFIYLTTSLSDMYDLFLPTLYQIDITDKENPFIYNEIEFDEPIITYLIPEIFDNFLILKNYGMEDRIYLLPELEFVATISDSLISLYKITDAIGVNIVYASLMDIYDVTDLTNIQLIGTIDMNPIHGSCGPRYFEMLNDTILIAGGQTAISFWNIADNANWEYISHYESGDYTIFGKNFTIISNYLALTRFDGLELIDISDIYNPQYVDFISYGPAEASASYNDNLYVATRYDGIQRYQVSNDEINFIENIFEYPSFRSGYIYLNYLFIQTYRHGLLLFDISNPNEPVEIQTILSNPDFKVLQGYGNLLALKDWYDYSYKIFDISDPLNPILIHTIPVGDYWEIGSSYLRFDNSESNTVYLFIRRPITKIKKYEISEPGNTVLLFEFTDLTGDSFFVRNGYGYLLSDINNYQNLYILYGLYENSPYLINTIEHFSDYQYSPCIDLYDDYLCLRYSSEYDETKFYNLYEPLNPEFVFELEIPSNWGPPVIFDNFIFTKTAVSSYVYDINGTPSGILEPIDSIYGLTYICSIDFYESVENNYLFTIEESDVGVFEFSYNHSVDDEILNQDKISLTNYPNPFSTSTTISFDLATGPCYATPRQAKSHEMARIKIYNIKGELIKQLSIKNSSRYISGSIEWDGKDENGKQVPSGIYLCKLSVGKEAIVRKVVLLR